MTLQAYIDSNFPQIKSQLGWNDSVNCQAIIDKTLELYGAASELLATDLVKLHALADVAVWRQALNDLSLDIAFSADGASFSRNQAVEAVRKNMQTAEGAALAYLPALKIIVHQGDPNPDWEA